MRKSRFLTMCGVFAAATLVAAPVYADDVPCEGTFSGEHDYNIYVMMGDECILDNAIVYGNVTVYPGGALRTTESVVKGNIFTKYAEYVRVEDETFVYGNVVVIYTDGDASWINDSVVEGNVRLGRNNESIDVKNNTVSGNVYFNGNMGTTNYISGNKIMGNLSCYGNDPVPTVEDNRVYGNYEGQCYDAYKMP